MGLQPIHLGLLALCVCGGGGAASRADKFASVPKNYEKHLVFRVFPNTSAQLSALDALYRNSHELDLDFWKAATGFNQFADIMVPERRVEFLARTLNETGARYKITIHDVQQLILEREAPKQTSWLSRFEDSSLFKAIFRRLKDDSSSRPRFGFGDYHGYAAIMKYLDDVARYYPHMAQTFVAGTSFEGRPIKGIKIGAPPTNSNKRAVWIDAGIHAREWASIHTALYFINILVTTYDTNLETRDLVDSLNFFILPLANPDGYEFSRDDVDPAHRLWRKNRANIKCRMDQWFRERCCGGADLNRNFDFHWSEVGSSDDACSEIYQGSAAFSEPESRAVRDMLLGPEMAGRTDAFITLHTYAQMWIHPYSHAVRTYPEDVQDIREVGLNGVAALERDFHTPYRFGTGADILYPSSGGSDDWAKGVAKVKYVYLLELRPADEVWDGFLLDPRQLIPTGKETWDGLKVVFRAVLDEARARNLVPLARQQFQPAPVTQRPFIAPITQRTFSQNAFSQRPVTQRIQRIRPSPTTTRTFTPAPVQFQQQQAFSSQSCVDRSPWCAAWIHNNAEVCRISSIYMRRDCARSCGFCRRRKMRFISPASGIGLRSAFLRQIHN